jgi:hypothetical protein
MSDNRAEKGKLFLFKNDNYTQGSNQPSRSGNGEINKEVLERINKAMEASSDGLVKLEVALWPKTSKAGNPYSFGIFDVQNPEYAPKGEPKPVDDDDDVPF